MGQGDGALGRAEERLRDARRITALEQELAATRNAISAGELDADSAPKAPDPEDRACSKRQWERRMQVYRAHVKAAVQQAT